ncbi:uncharacterized protein LOC5518363 isoform X4 [Nematostella vectensis]|uniref:uncharacterized protein LOC5518363 isoform X4 n=1 Tax=Nematostella vectensis TaxID=45351 RepID=UPI0020774B74|nr:uncharacterized protein LOC5518363 isoform X4 [Nematostella vectensis]
MTSKEPLDDLEVDKIPIRVTALINYDPFEAKFCASLYWLVFRATEDGGLEDIPSQVTSPIQRDSERRISIRPEVINFLVNGEVYGKVCDAIFKSRDLVMGHWAVIQTLSRHGFYVVENGDIAVTDSALQQRKPFRKSTHLALMDALMTAYSSQVITVQQVVQAVRRFASFNASRELPFDLEDALLLWVNKICTTLNESHLKQQKQHAEQLLQNQDKAKRFRFRRDQLQPKIQSLFPVIDDLLKDLSDGQCLLAIIMFYHPDAIKFEDIHFGRELSTDQMVHNVELFRSRCSQHICTSALVLTLEDILYSSQAMKPNLIALLAEIFHRCEIDTNTVREEKKKRCRSASGVLEETDHTPSYEPRPSARSSSAPMLASDIISAASPALGKRLMDLSKAKAQRSSSIPERLSTHQDPGVDEGKSRSETELNSARKNSSGSPFQLDFTARYETRESDNKDEGGFSDAQNPFSGIFQKPVLAREGRKHSAPSVLAAGGSPRVKPRGVEPRLTRRPKQKQRTLALEDWEMGEDDGEVHLTDLHRSQSLTGLDKNEAEPRRSFHAWQENSSSDTNLAATAGKGTNISLDFKAPRRQADGHGMRGGVTAVGKPRDDFMSQDSLYSCSPKSTDSLNMKPTVAPRAKDSSSSSGVADSVRSEASARELHEFEEEEARILARGSASSEEIRESRVNPAFDVTDEDVLNASVSSEDMNRFRMEVMQRLTQDKIRDIEHERQQQALRNSIEEDCARANLREENPPVGEGVGVSDSHGGVVEDEELLSPITETTEPEHSMNYVLGTDSSPPSHPSTAPSSPLSPLDVAPFTPMFFMTSPANTIEKKKYKTRAEKGQSLLGEDLPPGGRGEEPMPSVTPRKVIIKREKSGSTRSASFEQLIRGSYTVDQMSAAAATAAGIPVIDSEMTPGSRGNSTLVESPQTRGATSDSGKEPNATSQTGTGDVRIPPRPARDIPDSLENSPPSPGIHSRISQSRKPTASQAGDDIVIFDRKSTSDHDIDRHVSRDVQVEVRDAYAHDLSDHSKRDAPLRDNDEQFRTYSRKKQHASLESSIEAPCSPRSASKPVISGEMNGGPRASHVIEETEEGQFDDDGVEDQLSGRVEGVESSSHRHGDQVDARFVRSQFGDEDRTNNSARFATFNKQTRPQSIASPRHHGSSSPLNGFDSGHIAAMSEQFGEYNRQDRPHSYASPRHDAPASPSGRNAELGRFATFRKQGETPGESRGFSQHKGGHPGGFKSGSVEPDQQVLAPGPSSPRSAQPSGRSPEEPNSSLGRFATFRKPPEVQRFSIPQYYENCATNGALEHPGYSTEGAAHRHSTLGFERQHVNQTGNPQVSPPRQSYYGNTGPHSNTHELRISANEANQNDDLPEEPRPKSQAFTVDIATGELVEINSSSEMASPRSPGTSVARSRTFRKRPEGKVFETEFAIVSDQEGVMSPRDGDGGSAVTMRAAHAGRISWSDSASDGSTAGLHDAFDKKSQSRDQLVPSPSNRKSPGSSPGARISWVTAAKSGFSGQVVLNDRGEIEETASDEEQDEEKVNSKQLSLLKMQFEEKRRHIETEKRRNQEQWEEERRKLGQTAFWYMIGRTKGEEVATGSGENQVTQATQPFNIVPSSSKQPPPEPASSGQPSPPVGMSTPIECMSPRVTYQPPLVENGPQGPPSFGHGYHPKSTPQKPGYQSPGVHPEFQSPGVHPPTVNSRTGFQFPPSHQEVRSQAPQATHHIPQAIHRTQQDPQRIQQEARDAPQEEMETVEFRLSNFPPNVRPGSEPTSAVTATSPSSSPPHRKCWSVNPTVPPSPPVFVPPVPVEAEKPGTEGIDVTTPADLEVEGDNKKGFSMFISEDKAQVAEGLTPEQQKRRDKFLKMRQKRQEEDKAKKEAEMEKKRRREERQREAEAQKKLEEERRQQEEEIRRARLQQERLSRASDGAGNDGYATYRPGSGSNLAPAQDDHSAFAEFSGPQCYVKPSGKSNRKLIVNAISYVCLSGTVNKDAKERCLQAISESNGYHFMVLFKDGLKFRGLYSFNPENEQLYKVFGIGPRVITAKMIDNLYKYSSGGKEFVKIHSKTLSISVDGLSIMKQYWQSSKPAVQSKTMSNIKRPPKPPR